MIKNYSFNSILMDFEIFFLINTVKLLLMTYMAVLNR